MCDYTKPLNTEVQTLGTGHALAKHLVGSEDIRFNM